MSSNRAVLEPGTVIGKYEIIQRVGKGGFGDVYLVIGPKRVRYALKTEYLSAEKKAMDNELSMYKLLKKCQYVPTIHSSGSNEICRYFVMDLFGPSLSSCRSSSPGKRFTLRHTLFLAQRTLLAIRAVHRRGVVHRDIKASNFLIKPYAKSPLYLLDYGVSWRIIDPATKRVRPNVKGKFVGTAKYASPYAHVKQQLSYRDDLFSWFYMIAEFINRRLPWSRLRDKQQLYDAKSSIDASALRGSLPYQFSEIYKLIQQCEYGDVPDYRRIYQLIEDAKSYHSIVFSGREWKEIWSANEEALGVFEQDARARRYEEYPDEGFPDDDGAGGCTLM